MKVAGKRNRGHQSIDDIREDLQSCSLNEEEAQERVRWRSLIELSLRQPPATPTGQSRDR